MEGIKMNPTKQHIASDNYSGICPSALDYLHKANDSGHDLPYGEDIWTAKASDKIREIFEKEDAEVFFVFNGTAANSLALASLCQSYHSVIAAETAHIETDECGAPEFFSNGSKILLAPAINGKLTPAGIESLVTKRSDIHYPHPKVASVTQATELGTVYTADELKEVCATAQKYKLKVHMDGSRFSNAVASTGLSPAELTWKCGVDVLCFGGAKNGMPLGEAVVFFHKELAEDFAYRCKQAGQLASKMRFISAPWLGILETGAWLENAKHANRQAEKLEAMLRQIQGITIMFPRQANSVFVQMPETALQKLKDAGWRFYTFIGVGGARFMCPWDCSDEIINALASDIKKAIED